MLIGDGGLHGPAVGRVVGEGVGGQPGALVDHRGIPEAAVLVFLDAHAVPDGQTHHEAGEEIEVVLLTHAEVSKMCDDPAVQIDAKAWGVLYLYQQLGRFT